MIWSADVMAKMPTSNNRNAESARKAFNLLSWLAAAVRTLVRYTLGGGGVTQINPNPLYIGIVRVK